MLESGGCQPRANGVPACHSPRRKRAEAEVSGRGQRRLSPGEGEKPQPWKSARGVVRKESTVIPWIADCIHAVASMQRRQTTRAQRDLPERQTVTRWASTGGGSLPRLTVCRLFPFVLAWLVSDGFALRVPYTTMFVGCPAGAGITRSVSSPLGFHRREDGCSVVSDTVEPQSQRTARWWRAPVLAESSKYPWPASSYCSILFKQFKTPYIYIFILQILYFLVQL